MDAPVATVLVVLALAAGYAITCAIWPFAACRRCKGEGKFRSPGGRSWRTCRRCKGSGARLRIGRRILNHWSKAAQRGTR